MATVQALEPDRPTKTPGARSATPGRLRLRVAEPPALLPLQHPKLVAKPPSGPGWIHEIKLDGYRMQLDVRQCRATWWSRNGNNWTDRLPDLGALAAKLPAGVYDGEVCALDAEGEPDFSALRSFMGSRQTGRIVGEPVFFAFDLLTDQSGELRSKPLQERKARLCAALEPDGTARSTRIRYVDALPGADGPSLFLAAAAMGLEGIVSKRLDASYTGGPRRMETWLKAKVRPSQEVVIGGWETEGERFTGLMAGVWEGEQLRYVGTVGTGFGAERVAALRPRLEAVQAERSPFSGPGAPRPSRRLHWMRPELVAAVEIAEWTAAGNMRQASFKGLREDKPARDVVRERTT